MLFIKSPSPPTYKVPDAVRAYNVYWTEDVVFGESKYEKLTGSNLLELEPVGFAKPFVPAIFVEPLYNVKYPVAALYVVVLTSIIILELVEDGVIDTTRGTLT